MPAAMSFHLGKPLLVLLLVGTVAGTATWFERPSPRADLKVWVAALPHARTYREPGPDAPSLVEQFRLQTGQSVAVDLMAGRAMDIRLLSLFMNDTVGQEVPDLVEIDTGTIGKYFRPPVNQIGFLPLNDRLAKEGLLDTVLRSRFAPWTKDGVIFGLPHDVHPVTLTYRDDLYREAGIDLAQVKTWSELHEKGLAFVEYWRKRGVHGRWAIELPNAAADYVTVMLLQRGINVLDDRNRVLLSDPRVTDTICVYAPMVAGERRIAGQATPGGTLWTQDVARGDLCATITPDWKVGYLRTFATTIAGRVRMMPLPRFDPTDSPTSTWGGTMIGIPRRARDPEASWRLAKWLYLSDEGLKARQRFTMILPPVKSQWKDPAYHQPDAFFGGQSPNAMYVELADQIPPRYLTPFTAMGTAALSSVLNKAVDHVAAHGEAGLRQAVQGWLDEEARDLQRRVEFGEYRE
jgi:arabinosaccharide transport system substrate-binding protein